MVFLLSLTGLALVHQGVIATSGNDKADMLSRQKHLGRVNLRIQTVQTQQPVTCLCGTSGELRHVRLASLWIDVPDCRVHFGVPADWETRRGTSTGFGAWDRCVVECGVSSWSHST